MQTNPNSTDSIGLCRTCVHARVVKHPHGGEDYWRCGLHDTDPTYPKYPRLPVTACEGYQPRETKS